MASAGLVAKPTIARSGPGRRGWPGEGLRWLPLIVLTSAAALLVVVPLLALLQAALEDGPAALASAVASAAPAILASAWTSVAATVVAVGLGGAIAVLGERIAVPGRRGLRLAMLVAFIVPGYVAAVGWLNAYGTGGLLDDALGLAAPALVGPLGVIVVLGVEAAPIAYLIVAAGLATRTEPDLERAARDCGADALTVLRTVTLPLLRPFIAASAVISFVLSMTSFGVPAVLGIPAGLNTMTTRIYRDLATSADPDSFVRGVSLAIVLAIGVAVLMAFADVLMGRRPVVRSGAFSGPPGGARGAARYGPVALAGGVLAWSVVGLVVIAPLLALLLTALTRAPGLDPVPANWTLDNFREAIDGHSLKALANSTLLAGVAAAAVVFLAVATVALRKRQGARSMGGLAGLSFALPGSTLAVAMLLAYGAALRDTLLIIVVAYLAKFWALGYRPIAAGLDGIAPDVYRAARASGAGALTTTRTIVLPLLRPMIVAGGLVVFIFGLHEVTMSSLLHGPGSTTLAVLVLNLQELGDAGPTAALAVLLTLVVAVASLPLLRRGGALDRTGWRR